MGIFGVGGIWLLMCVSTCFLVDTRRLVRFRSTRPVTPSSLARFEIAQLSFEEVGGFSETFHEIFTQLQILYTDGRTYYTRQ